MELLIFLLLIFAFFGFSAWRGYVRARQLNRLVDHGLATPARVVRKLRFHVRASGPRYRVIYEYDTPNGTRTHSAFVSQERFDSLEVGQPLAVRFLREDPRIVAPEFVLDQMRTGR